MGAGSITFNVKSDKTLAIIIHGEKNIETGIKKIGAMLGDYVEVESFTAYSIAERSSINIPMSIRYSVCAE